MIVELLLDLALSVFLTFAGGFVTRWYYFRPIKHGWTKQENDLAICCTPVAIYVVYRLYTIFALRVGGVVDKFCWKGSIAID